MHAKWNKVMSSRTGSFAANFVLHRIKSSVSSTVKTETGDWMILVEMVCFKFRNHVSMPGDRSIITRLPQKAVNIIIGEKNMLRRIYVDK